jgi:hypothetical protein
MWAVRRGISLDPYVADFVEEPNQEPERCTKWSLSFVLAMHLQSKNCPTPNVSGKGTRTLMLRPNASEEHETNFRPTTNNLLS